MSYTINSDGTVTRDTLNTPNNSHNYENYHDYSWIWIIIFIVVGFVIIYYNTTKPSVEIESVRFENEIEPSWIIFRTNQLVIHVKFHAENLLNEKLYVYAYFYQGKNRVPLYNQYGGQLYFYDTDISPYKSTIFNDFKIEIPYDKLKLSQGVYYSMDIVVCNDNQKELARKKNISLGVASPHRW